MSIAHLLTFNIALIIALISPGPAMLIAIQSTLSSGRKAGIFAGFGLALMAAIWTLFALLGLEAIFVLAPWAFTTVKILGALYLIYIGYSVWRSADTEINTVERPLKNSFAQGFMVNILNPKSALFAAAVLVVIFPKNLTPFEMSIITLNHLVIEIAFYAVLAICMSTETIRDRYLKAKCWLDRVTAVFLSALGLRILFSR